MSEREELTLIIYRYLHYELGIMNPIKQSDELVERILRNEKKVVDSALCLDMADEIHKLVEEAVK